MRRWRARGHREDSFSSCAYFLTGAPAAGWLGTDLAELGNRDRFVDVLEHDLDRRTDVEFVVPGADDVGDDARPLLHFHERDVVGKVTRKAGMVELVEHHPGRDPAATRKLFPAVIL